MAKRSRKRSKQRVARRGARPQTEVTPAARPEPRRPRLSAFPIVGIGASAGGLEALEGFLKNVPADCGIAFVVVQHLDPTRKGGPLVELLQHATSMQVSEAVDRVTVQPNHVYVIPPGSDMSLLHGVVHLLPQVQPRGLNLPIDFFFRSLADDQQEQALAVILSGMGSDGLLGLRAIKEKAGATFVQEASTAEFSAMPRAVIDAGLADVVAAPEDLPDKIIGFAKRALLGGGSNEKVADRTQGALDKIFVLLRSHTGNDFSLYKQTTLLRRIERRMGLHQVDIDQYVRLLRENPREIELLFKELLIGVTAFFRDPAAWEVLRKEALPALLANRGSNAQLRAWVPGCSTGEEAYTLAMVFREAMEPLRPLKNLTLQVFATDLDADAIDYARQGHYPINIAADVTAERLRRYFTQDERGYRVGKEIREMVVFAPQNLIMAPPFTKLDLLACRNLLIYLSPALQKKLIPLFHYSLNPGGMLFLGSAETTGTGAGLFATVDGKARLYRRVEQPVPRVPVDFPVAAAVARRPASGEAEPSRQERGIPPNLQVLADRVLVQRFSPLGVLCNDKGDVLYISGRAASYFEPPVGKANLNVFAMAREGLRYELSNAFDATLKKNKAVTVRALELSAGADGHPFDLTIERLTEPRELEGLVLVVIAETPDRPPASRALRSSRSKRPAKFASLERQLAHAREETQLTREEMQTSQEELRSTNEELQSTNEELQSSNEELTTSKEEMQSLNEELQTVNHELQAKVDELSRNSNDMKNLLNSTEIATLFLDDDLNVRRFTTPTTRIIKLIPGDAGRPITDIVSDLDYPGLADDAREVLRTLVFSEKQMGTRDGRWFSVRIMPYRTLENLIDGLVITFRDATASRLLETALKREAHQLTRLAESLPNLVFSAAADGMCDYLSPQWVDYTGLSEKEQLGYGWLAQVHPDDRERVRERWHTAVREADRFEVTLRLRAADASYHWFKARAVPERDARGAVVRWYGTHTDVDDLTRTSDPTR